ncbi:histamine N-methyltransferase-like [Glandiceps talaboti]
MSETRVSPTMGQLTSLYYNQEREIDVLREFIRQSDERLVIMNWIKKAVPSITKRVHTSTHRSHVNVLGIGSGSGEVDRMILHEVVPTYNTIYTQVIEPNPEQIEMYKKLLNTCHELNHVEFDFRQQTSDQYLKSCQNERRKFDIIHMIQVLYFVNDIEDTILQFYQHHLNTNGVIIIIHISGRQTAWHRFNTKYEDILPVFMHDNSSGLDIEGVLDKHNLKYSKTVLPSYLIISECFQERSPIGSLIWDYLTDADHFEDLASEDLMRNMKDFISRDQGCYRQDDKVMFQNDLDVFVVHKSSKYNV